MLNTHTLYFAWKHWIPTVTKFGLKTRCAPRPQFHKQYFLSTCGDWRARIDYVLLHSWQAEHAVGFTRESQPCSMACLKSLHSLRVIHGVLTFRRLTEYGSADDTMVRFWKSQCRGHKPVRSVCQETHSTSRRKPTPALGEDRASGNRSEYLSAEERAQQHFWWDVTVVSWLILPRTGHGTTHRPYALPAPGLDESWASYGKQVLWETKASMRLAIPVTLK